VLTAHDRWENSTGAIRHANFTHKQFIYGLKDRAVNFTRLDKRSCLKQYIDPLKATGDLIVIAANWTSVQNNGSSLIQGWVDGNSADKWSAATAWICSAYETLGWTRFCSLDWALSFLDDWVLETWEAPRQRRVAVAYCLVDELGDNHERCGLHYSAPVMGLVCFCTLIGALLILWTARKYQVPTIVTLGDAIASFLEHPEIEVYGVDRTARRSIFGRKRHAVAIEAIPWSAARPTTWFRTVSVGNWLLSYTV
jgi:hypothetical protein